MTGRPKNKIGLRGKQGYTWYACLWALRRSACILWEHYSCSIFLQNCMTCNFPLLLSFLPKDPNLDSTGDFCIIWKLEEVSGFEKGTKFWRNGWKLSEDPFSSIVDPSIDYKLKPQIHILRCYWCTIWKRSNTIFDKVTQLCHLQCTLVVQ